MKTPLPGPVRQSIRRGSPPVELDLDSVGLLTLAWGLCDEMAALGIVLTRIESSGGKFDVDYVVPESIGLRVRARDVREKYRRRTLSTCQECGRRGLYMHDGRYSYVLCGYDFFRLWRGWGLPRSELKW